MSPIDPKWAERRAIRGSFLPQDTPCHRHSDSQFRHSLDRLLRYRVFTQYRAIRMPALLYLQKDKAGHQSQVADQDNKERSPHTTPYLVIVSEFQIGIIALS